MVEIFWVCSFRFRSAVPGNRAHSSGAEADGRRKAEDRRDQQGEKLSGNAVFVAVASSILREIWFGNTETLIMGRHYKPRAATNTSFFHRGGARRFLRGPPKLSRVARHCHFQNVTDAGRQMVDQSKPSGRRQSQVRRYRCGGNRLFPPRCGIRMTQPKQALAARHPAQRVQQGRFLKCFAVSKTAASIGCGPQAAMSDSFSGMVPFVFGSA